MSQQFNKIRTTLTLDPEVHAHYDQIAREQERSLSWIINNLLKEQMKEKEGS